MHIEQMNVQQCKLLYYRARFIMGGWNMKSQALQELVKKIFGDEETKRQFLKDPENILTQFTLTEQEKKAILKTHAKLGLVTGDSTQLEAALDPLDSWFAPIP